MKKYEEPIFEISIYDLEDAILSSSSICINESVYNGENTPTRTFN